jgi:hypothetical protein
MNTRPTARTHLRAPDHCHHLTARLRTRRLDVIRQAIVLIIVVHHRLLYTLRRLRIVTILAHFTSACRTRVAVCGSNEWVQ